MRAAAVPIRSHQNPEELNSEPLTSQEAWGLFDETAQLYLAISGREFLARFDRGTFGDIDSDPRVMRVASLLPLVRKSGARQNPF